MIINELNSRGYKAEAHKKKLGVSKFFVMPSSVHEMMLIPCDDESKLDMYSNLVKEVNYTQVDPVDRLTDRAYILEI